MSSHAFYLAPQDWGAEAFLDAAEAAHVRVLRLRAGESVTLLDGAGRTARGCIKHIQKKTVQVEILEECLTPPPRSRAILALALSKAVRRSFFMEKAVELGAWEIWLWTAARSQGSVTPQMADACRGQLIAGMKQSLNPWLPVVRIAPDANAVARNAREADWRVLPWESQDNVPMLGLEAIGRAGVTVYVIGPEGGFAPEEVECLQAGGFVPASLGKRILRCETAATVCLGLHSWASQLPGKPDFDMDISGTK